MIDLQMVASSVCRDVVRRVAVRHARSFLVTNFRYPDGDYITLSTIRDSGVDMVTDLGSTLERLRGDTGKGFGDRDAAIVDAVCRDFAVERRGNDLVMAYRQDHFPADLIDYCQAVVRITTLAYSSQGRQASTFPDLIDRFIHDSVEPQRAVTRDWTLEANDPHGVYPVDYRLNGRGQPANIFCIASRTKGALVAATANFLHAHDDEARTLVLIDPDVALGSPGTERLQLSADQIRYGLYGQEEEIKDFALAE